MDDTQFGFCYIIEARKGTIDPVIVIKLLKMTINASAS